MKPKQPATSPVEASNDPNPDFVVDVKYLGVEDDRLNAIQRSAIGLVQAMFGSDQDHNGCECVWPLLDAVWPARSTSEYRTEPISGITLSLVPLSRIGQMEGKSGSLVLLGCFQSSLNPNMPASHPLVIKTAPADSGKLVTEFENALSIRPFAYDNKDVFSIPFKKDVQDGFDVLWSLFSASIPLWTTSSTQSPDIERWRVTDLRDFLDDGKVEMDSAEGARQAQIAEQILNSAFSTMRNLHVPFGRRKIESRDVVKEYEWYLRGFGTIWGRNWATVFGDASERICNFGGKRYVNPVWLIEKLKACKWDLQIGAIHGDFHAGNIVVTADSLPRIIDFGWAQEDAHVAKDFVLLECNLRFLFLRPQLTMEEIELMTTWTDFDADVPTGLSEYSTHRIGLIESVRNQARQTFAGETDWNKEYLVPLFLVAFGLLRFAPQLGNQQAAILTVLSLASQIESKLFQE